MIDYAVSTSDAILFRQIIAEAPAGKHDHFLTRSLHQASRAIIKAMKRLMTKKEAAEYCGLSHSGVR